MRITPILLVVAACGDEHLAIEAHCNPLGAADHCAVPFPSSAFEVDDASTATGRRVAIPVGALPANVDGVHIDPAAFNLADGFSPSAPMIVAFRGGVSAAGLPPVDNFDLSLTADSPTVLLDLTTGELVPHFSEVDTQAADVPDSQALFIRPALRLAGGHRYAVAITDRVTAASGGALAVPRGFAALRDGTVTDHALLEGMRPRFDEVLDGLATAGIPTGRLVLAWDFTVASDEFLHRDMIATRDRTIAALMGHKFEFDLLTDRQPDTDHPGIERYVVGRLGVPLFLNTAEIGVDGTTLARDAGGLPAVQGFYQVPFAAIIPECAYTSPTPVPMILYGHGLLGDATEVDCCGIPPVAIELCMVVAGTDMRGMSVQDTGAVAVALNDGSKSDGVFEVLHQGMANHIALAQAMRTTLAQELFIDPAQNNKVLVDPTRVFYWGLSQGGIFGATVMAYEPTITRGVLGSGAANYSFLLDRSSDWPKYRTILNGAYPDPLDDELIIALMQARWDKTEPAGIAHTVLEGTATGVPPKQLLMQIVRADEQVSELAAYWEARSMNAPILTPTISTPWGLTAQTSPLAGGSALAVYDCAAPALPATNVPPAKTACSMVGRNELHDLPAHVAAGRRQMKEFFATGRIVNECAGACTCATGACN